MIEFGETHYAVGKKVCVYCPGRTREELEHLISLVLTVWPRYPWPSRWDVKIENQCAIVTTPSGVKAAYPLNNTQNWKDIFSRQAIQEQDVKPKIN